MNALFPSFTFFGNSLWQLLENPVHSETSHPCGSPGQVFRPFGAVTPWAVLLCVCVCPCTRVCECAPADVIARQTVNTRNKESREKSRFPFAECLASWRFLEEVAVQGTSPEPGWAPLLTRVPAHPCCLHPCVLHPGFLPPGAACEMQTAGDAGQLWSRPGQERSRGGFHRAGAMGGPEGGVGGCREGPGAAMATSAPRSFQSTQSPRPSDWRTQREPRVLPAK